MADAGPASSPESRARGVLQELHGGLALERDRWMRAAMAALAVAAVAVSFGIWAAVRAEYVPYIVAVDEIGRPAPVLAPRELGDWPDAVVRHELAAFLRDWRSVSTDRAAMTGRLRRIQFFLERNSAADRKVVAWAQDRETSPFEVTKTHTVEVEVVSVNLVGGRSWIAEWTERPRSRSSGQTDPLRRYSGTFVLGQRRVRDDHVLLQNPLGMVIEDFDIVRVR